MKSTIVAVVAVAAVGAGAFALAESAGDGDRPSDRDRDSWIAPSEDPEVPPGGYCPDDLVPPGVDEAVVVCQVGEGPG